MGLAKEDGARDEVDRRENFVRLQRPAIANVRQAQVKMPTRGCRYDQQQSLGDQPDGASYCMIRTRFKPVYRDRSCRQSAFIPMARIRLQVVPKANIVELVVLITGPDFLMSSCRWF